MRRHTTGKRILVLAVICITVNWPGCRKDDERDQTFTETMQNMPVIRLLGPDRAGVYSIGGSESGRHLLSQAGRENADIFAFYMQSGQGTDLRASLGFLLILSSNPQYITFAKNNMDLIAKGGELVMWRFALGEKGSGIPTAYADALVKCAAGSNDPLARLIMAEQEQKKGNADKAGRLYLWVMAVSSIWSGPAITEFDTLPEATQLSTCRELLKTQTVEGVGAAYCLLDNAQYEKEAALYLEKAVSNPIGNSPTHAEGFLKGYRERNRIRESQPATSGISPR